MWLDLVQRGTQDGTALHSIAHNIAQRGTPDSAVWNTRWRSVAQHGTSWRSTAQPSAGKYCNTTQHGAADGKQQWAMCGHHVVCALDAAAGLPELRMATGKLLIPGD